MEKSDIYISIGARIREERERLGFSQRALATRMAITHASQVKYEGGATQPNTGYLYLFNGIGADVQYIVTGARCAGTLTDDEAQLLTWFRAMSDRGREAAICLITSYVASGEKSRGGTQIHIAGDTAQVISGGEVNQSNASISTGGRRRR